jgi:hypothetical protein
LEPSHEPKIVQMVPVEAAHGGPFN